MRSFSASRFFWVFSLLVSGWLFAADYPVAAYLGIEQGLSNNSVRCIYQDRRGFMWFGTYDGLNRYDGYRFKVFRNNFNNTASLVNNWINAIKEDVAGNLWVGTRQGICIYRTLTDNFSPVYYRGTRERIAAVVRNIESDDEGNMFIATTEQGLIFVPHGDSTGVEVPIENGSADERQPDIPAVKKGSAGKIWVFVRGKGLCFYDYPSKKLKLFNASLASVNCLEAKGGWVWAGTKNGVYRFNVMTNSCEAEYTAATDFRQADVVAITLDKRNRLWMATDGNGLLVANTQSGELSHLKAGRERQSLSSNSVYSVWEDRENRMWVGSLRGGINLIEAEKRPFQTVFSDPAGASTLASNYVFTFYEEPGGKLWVGTDGDGLSVWDRTTNAFTNYRHNAADPGSLSNDFITDIIGDFENNVWVATFKGGINRYDRRGGKFEHFDFQLPSDENKATNPLTYVILEDKERSLWTGSLTRGLFRLNRQANLFEVFDDKLKDLFVLAEDNNNRFWGGNLSQLVQIDRTNKKHRFFLIGKPVRSIHEDKRGNFWVGTEGGGLLLFDREEGKITARYTTDDGLCNNSVLKILEDENGNLWLSTFNGLAKFNTGSHTFTNYYQSDGLQSNQFNYNAAFKLKKGEMVFGGIKGFSLFNPAVVTPHTNMPPVHFTDIKISNTSLEQESGLIIKAVGNEVFAIKIPFDKAVVSIEFAALEYSAPEKIKYAFYLEGWDRGWNYPSNTRTAIYTHLSEGNYTLRVKNTNTEGIWNKEERRLLITILPPWYRSWLAYTCYLLLAVALVVAYLWYRTKQTRLKYEVRIANLNAENERAEKQRSLAELQREKVEREKGVAELALEKAEKEKSLAQLAVEKAELERERAVRERGEAEREKERILNEKERELNERKIDFFTNISHEFRTPLTLIINPLKDYLKKKSEAQDRTGSDLGTVYRNARRLLSLVDQLLLFRKAESGLDKIKPSQLPLCKLASEVYLCFTQQARIKNIAFRFDCPNEDMEIYADREKLEIILYNLLSNALKYTPANGQVSFTIHELPETVVIEVQDTGSGIPKQTGERLFDKFYRAENPVHAPVAGFGIGLFLVKHFTEQHKGAISYESNEGQGSTFILSLRKGAAHFAGETIVSEYESGPVLLEDLKEAMPLEDPVATERRMPSDNLVTDKQTILLIDDDEQIRDYLAQLFRENYILHQARDGEEGLKAAHKYRPDLIVSDVHMQGMNGVDLCKRIKEDDLLNHIPVILLTASTSDELKLKGVEDGADDYITKPFDNDLLTARVANLLKSRNSLQKYFYSEITLNKAGHKVSPEFKEFLEKCISVVEEHLDEDNFSIKTLQKELGMSYSNLHRKIKMVSGQSANVFIRFIRLRRAAEMLITTAQNVNETALLVGINDVKYFREQFNKLFGMNPSEYIKRYRNVHGKQFTVDREAMNPEK